jgi:hypothetical protein
MDLLLEFLKKPKKYQEKMKLPLQHYFQSYLDLYEFFIVENIFYI